MKHKSGFVNIVGNPNVGKSTLMNALVGEKLSVITNKAQTTRHRIIGILNKPNFQIVFSDTPGIIKPAYKLQENMMNSVNSAFVDADILIYIVEVGEKRLKNEEIFNKINQISIPILLLINKIDLVKQEEVKNYIEYWANMGPNAQILPISALNNFNIETIILRLLELLPICPPYYEKDAITDRSQRFLVEEIIREKILLHYKKEIPYSVEIKVEEFLDTQDLVKIRAIIYVMRETQKGIIIGHKGMGLRRIGAEARRDIEKLLGKKVYLQTPIKVKKKWREDSNQLKKFGYQ